MKISNHSLNIDVSSFGNGSENAVAIEPINNFFHFLVELVPQVILLDEKCRISTVYGGSHIPILKTLLPEADFLPIGCAPNHINRLKWKSSPLFQWGQRPWEHVQYPSFCDAMRGLRMRLLRNCTVGGQKPCITLIQRKVNRRLENAFQWLQAGKEVGIEFFEIYPEEYTLDEIKLLMQRTRLLIGSHGAGLSNMIFMQPGAHVIECLPRGFLWQGFATLARSLGFEYTRIIAPEYHPTVLANPRINAALQRGELTLSEIGANYYLRTKLRDVPSLKAPIDFNALLNVVSGIKVSAAN